MMRLFFALTAPAVLAAPAHAASYLCRRGDAAETQYTPASAGFKQFVKYSFDRIALTLEKTSIGATGIFKCERMASP